MTIVLAICTSVLALMVVLLAWSVILLWSNVDYLNEVLVELVDAHNALVDDLVEQAERDLLVKQSESEFFVVSAGRDGGRDH